jgi:hypothetical protein
MDTMCAERPGAVIRGKSRDKTLGSRLESGAGEQSSAGRRWRDPRNFSSKWGILKNRTLSGATRRAGIIRRSLAATAAVLAVTAGTLVPASPALAANDLRPVVTTEAAKEPAAELEPGSGNTAAITMTNGIGLTARLKISANGKESVWTAPAPATAATYTVIAPYKVAVAGFVRLQAVALKNGAEVAWGGTWTVWRMPGTGSATPKVDFGDYSSPGAPAKTIGFSGLGSGLTGTTVALQRQDAGVWKTVWTSSALAPNEPWAQFPAYTFKKEGSASFRALLISAGKTIATSPTRTLSYQRQPTSVSMPINYLEYGLKPFGTAEGRVAARTQWSQTYRLDSPVSDRTGRLQELKGGTWVTLQELSFKKSNGYQATMKTPLTTGTVTRKYRVTIDASVQERAWTSSTATIEHVDPARYTGYTKASYDYMKRYCPKQVITLRGPGTSYARYPSYQIQMATGITDKKALQFVSLHECAHIISYKLYASDTGQLEKRMNSIYGTFPAGVEQLADCMASAMGADIEARRRGRTRPLGPSRPP